MAKSISFFDTEIGIQDKKLKDAGAVRSDGAVLHTTSPAELSRFLSASDWLCGHNVLHHDLQHLPEDLGERFVHRVIDTLYLSPLFFPRKPYHKLSKDEHLTEEEENNPVNDSKKAQALFYDEVSAFQALPIGLKKIYCGLLYPFEEFRGFFDYVEFRPYHYQMAQLIREEFKGCICANAGLDALIKHYPKELAYASALISTNDPYSITPPWLRHTFPKINNVMRFLCNTPCADGCEYCEDKLNIDTALKSFFGYDSFHPFQEAPVQAAVQGKSLLVVFPTGGGKSVTFQVPALMAGRNERGLTVVIVPLLSLMKDQVDGLSRKHGIDDAVTINGMLDPIERKDAIERVRNGQASLLYISPEMLRSKTIEALLLSRNVVRFVIDEAHCFSAWGQDFRVDYLYIAEFIRKLQESKQTEKRPIPISCFTATAKQKVISDIYNYFKEKLGLELEIFSTTKPRENLHYQVFSMNSEDEKYTKLRELIMTKQCPTIVYVSRVPKTERLKERLLRDGIEALAYNGKMDAKTKIENQDAFMSGRVPVMVATSAFGMGVDKDDVGLVIHYEISDSLENYVQEAGRAGRNPNLQADCYILFNNSDLDKHFILLNQTKLSIGEVQQVWRAIKELTKSRPGISCSPLEIARQAGWDDTAGPEMETRVKTAIAALENAGYLNRGRNVPQIYATSILAKNMAEASERIRRSSLFSEPQRERALRIIKSLISRRSISDAGNADAESRIDYLADVLGLEKEQVIEAIGLMRQEGLLRDENDMSAYILESDSRRRSSSLFEGFARLEKYLLDRIADEEKEGAATFHFKELNDAAQAEGLNASNVKNIRTLLYYLAIKGYIVKEENKEGFSAKLSPMLDKKLLSHKLERRLDLCRFILDELYAKAEPLKDPKDEARPVTFSLVGLFKDYEATPKMDEGSMPLLLADMEDALLYLSKIGALKIEGGFLVLYNAMHLRRLIRDNRIQYKVDDYRMLDEFYQQKIRQIHIVGEYARLLEQDRDLALRFVQDYFSMEGRRFIAKYFKGERAKEIERNITPERYRQLFGNLSEKQAEIIHDDTSKHIVIAAGPGSGKTRVLVHKLASLLTLEDVKHEQLLMVTFSRAAATEFKKRLLALVENAAHFVEIKTFHSYCFDLLGKVGNQDRLGDVVKEAAEMIRSGEVERGRIAKSVLVIDEAQDMDEHEFALVSALMEANEEMRVIAVGDDDQNIYEFRGSDSKYLRKFVEDYGATKYEMTENYRSGRTIVALANAFSRSISHRMKEAPCLSMTNGDGTVELVRHKSSHMEEALVNNLLQGDTSGRTCVLTTTNDAALRILWLLTKHGRRAKLIQSLDGFKLYNLLEVRAFLALLDKEGSSPLISERTWEAAKEELFRRHRDSACIENIRRMIEAFEAEGKTKYRTALDEFIKESAFEDFYDDGEQGTVFISTIHKAKGREFDNVYILLKNTRAASDAEKRALYVGITRAKSALHIHTNTDVFDGYGSLGICERKDDALYEEPEEMMLQTTHRDVVLDFFKNKRPLLASIRSGMPLKVDDSYLTAEIGGKDMRVAKFSKAFSETLSKLEAKGYRPTGATAQFIVAWKGEADTEETPILLTGITLSKVPKEGGQ